MDVILTPYSPDFIFATINARQDGNPTLSSYPFGEFHHHHSDLAFSLS
jgi:hypothetical protein